MCILSFCVLGEYTFQTLKNIIRIGLHPRGSDFFKETIIRMYSLQLPSTFGLEVLIGLIRWGYNYFIIFLFNFIRLTD
jgi:hypothetical protein